jgi:cellulose synthase/poly-beta-1,6-N-acetylglucosamine synthase-like glycosyltransferase
MSMPLTHPWDVAVLAVEYVLFAYFVGANGYYLITGTIALARLPWFVRMHVVDPVQSSSSTLDQPVSILIPAYNEGRHIVGTINSLLALDYANYEIIAIDDGSQDDTLAKLHQAFNLESYEGIYRSGLPTRDVREVYQSMEYPQLRVVHKSNGGKADALNAGLNLARFPLILCGDGDSRYDRRTLQWMVEPFQKNPRTVAVGGTIAVGLPDRDERGDFAPSLPKKLIQRFQVLEYLRAFLATRMGFASFNGLGIISGACGLWKRDVLLACGGFRVDTIWEDLEMTLRVHNYCINTGRPYRIAFTPYPVCWTDVPDSAGAVYRQRRGWHRHLSECVSIHRKLLFSHPRFFNWVTMPYFVFFEWLAPLVIVFGLAFSIAGAVAGFLAWTAQWWLLGLVFTLATLGSLIGILLDEISYTAYRSRETGPLLVAALLENFGYRQFVALANLAGLLAWLFRLPPARGGVRYPGIFTEAWLPQQAEKARANVPAAAP